MTTIKILVATHKECPLPNNEIFLPIQVGKKLAANKMNIQGDDEGDNISEKNPNYCELTAHYWAWKNLKNVDYIGLCHYRRYFNIVGSSIFNLDKYILPFNNLSLISYSEKKILTLLKKYDILLSKPVVYAYDLHTNYCYAHQYEDYMIMKNIIEDKYPEYLKSFNYIFLCNNKLVPYNMFLTSSSVFDEYSTWIFNLLNEIEKQVKISDYPFQKRVFGYMSERLLMVYVHHNKLKIKHLPVFFLTEQDEKQESFLRYYLRNLRNNLVFKLSRIGTKKYDL